MKTNHILLLQETWLYEFEKNYLNKDLGDDIQGIGKFVDSNNPISPVQKPRGYGGVAIVWRKDLDKYIKPIPDGGNRIMGVLLQSTPCSTLLLSVYMPCKGIRDRPA